MATVVVDLNDHRPIWTMPGWARNAIEAATPDGWTVEFMSGAADGSGDGVVRAPLEVLDAVADARVYMGYGIPAQVLEAGPSLEWVHSGAAGVGSSLTPALLARDLTFTNSAGIHGPPMAETVLAMLLFFARGFDRAIDAQRRATWGAKDFWAADVPVRELGGSTVGIVGYGGVGRLVADRVTAFGASVLGVRRERRAEDPAYVVGFREVDRVIRSADHLVLCVPETELTRGLMGRERLWAMKPGSVLVNVGRGALVDSEALLEALDRGPIRGAGLDVVHQEPLPDGHPLFHHPRVLLTPHVSATTARFWERQTELICGNLDLFAHGRPLRNVVDLEAGY
ncbi:MAG: D-2-hydroxyacid dehydrogenase [Gemmatimonadetes bacterium]|nr:D-2-hydroxyacid dehydrogenase [Gemmatimonadota bacterium]